MTTLSRFEKALVFALLGPAKMLKLVPLLKPKLNIAWLSLDLLRDAPSPALVIGLDAVESNLRKMLAIAGGPERLRPHVKTHKLPHLIQRQLALGINKFKCATIAEAEMCAKAGAPDVLIAYQLVGPNVQRLLALQQKYPKTKFSTITDDPAAWRPLAAAAEKAGTRIEVLLDLDIGQHRTGVAPGDVAITAYRELAGIKSFNVGGLHAYDGHLQQPDAAERASLCAAAIAPVLELRGKLTAMGLPVPRIVAGGAPTFPFHAARGDVECSPGTTVLWDASYALTLADIEFQNAAIVLTRVVSKPAEDRLTLDLGHKALASEMPHPRVIFPELPEAEAVTHSEEHLVLKTPQARKFAIGDALAGVPWHICPTLALHAEALLIENGRLAGSWPIEARARKISV